MILAEVIEPLSFVGHVRNDFRTVFVQIPFLKIRLSARVFAFVRRKLVNVVIAFSPCLSTKRKSSIRKTRFYSSFARARRFSAVAFSPCLSRERASLDPPGTTEVGPKKKVLDKCCAPL